MAIYNIGAALQEKGKLEEAITAYDKAISIKPDYFEAYNNMGVTLHDQGKLEDAIEAYNKTLNLKPDYADAHNNMGTALKDQGKLDQAVEAYNKALNLKPDYAEAHLNLSAIKKYNKTDEQFFTVQELCRREDLSEDVICILSFALAKMYEDIGDLNQAFIHLSNGNALRRKLLKYSINQDQELFTTLKKHSLICKKAL
jgi:tetratricopeptide (TPR) repeat protein